MRLSSVRGHVIQYHDSLIPATFINAGASWKYACREDELCAIPNYFKLLSQGHVLCRDMQGITPCTVERSLDVRYSIYLSIKSFPGGSWDLPGKSFWKGKFCSLYFRNKPFRVSKVLLEPSEALDWNSGDGPDYFTYLV